MSIQNLHFSNRIEVLFEEMAPFLFDKPLGKKIVVVPSLAMKQWIVEALVYHPDYGISFGFQPLLLQQSVAVLREITSDRAPYLNAKAIGWQLHIELVKILQSKKKDPLFDPVYRYCAKNPGRNAAELALKLADLFVQYGENAPEEMQKWAALPSGDWQQELWKRLFPAAELQPLQQPKIPTEVHLFGFSYLSELKQSYFERLASVLPVHYWALSPCRLFWEDLKTSKERARQIKAFKGKEEQVEELEAWLDSGNVLLSQDGRLGRHWMKKLEEMGVSAEEKYVVPKDALQYASYEEHILDGVYVDDSHWSLLSAVQSDLVLLRDPKEEKIDFRADESIKIQSAPSPLREVEALYDQLVQTLDRHKELTPRDVVVLVADFTLYEPLIRLVFDRKESHLKAHIIEGSRSKTELIQGLLSLIGLSESRFEREQVLQFFKEPLFLSKQGLTYEDWAEFSDWIANEKVVWGIDRSHREALFPSKAHENRGSWASAQESLIRQLAVGGEVSYSQAENFGKWLALFKDIVTDLTPMIENRSLPLTEWVDALKQLVEKYLDSDGRKEESAYLLNIFHSLSQQAKDEPHVQMEFAALRVHLLKEIEEGGFTYEERKLQAVRFCSLLPMRAHPSKVVALLGMSEGVMPKSSTFSSLDLFSHFAPKAFRPASADFDRYLFLETLLAARKQLLVFYTRSEEKRAPSLLVEELLRYLDAGYAIDGKTPSECLVQHHPEFNFDPLYFKEGSALRSASVENFKAAQSYMQPQKSAQESFSFNGPEPLSDDSVPTEVSLKDLRSLLSHPLRSYVIEGLCVKTVKYEVSESPLNDFEEDDYLTQDLLKNALKRGFDEALTQADEKGGLPLAPFKDAFIERLKDKYRLMKLQTQAAGLSDFFEVEFCHGQKTIEKVSDLLLKMPPAKVHYKGQEVLITGVLPLVTKKGIVSPFDPKPEDRIREMAERWMLHEIPEEYVARVVHLPAKNEEKRAELPNWELLLDHHLRAKRQAIPLHPKLALAILKKDAKALQKELKASVETSYMGTEDLHSKWAFRKQALPDAESLIKDWHEISQKLFKEEES
ncbi:MAG: exodeoxyribonuclease V subunit gamma [Parachlamydiaceae bacterium]